ncbi:MAG: QueT transporter family protein [Clostridiales bacterium]|nr:QueT transporter family protein [Candidatus Coliplasma caballi]
MYNFQKSRAVTTGAMIAAGYAVLTLLLFQFSSREIQVRVSEALCVLPLLTPAAVPGLFFGCFLSNLLLGNPIDAVFGSLITLAAAILTLRARKLGDKVSAWVAPLPAVLLNAIAVPLILYFGYGIRAFGNADSAFSVLALQSLSVLIGQTIACYGLGLPLLFLLRKINSKYHFFEEKGV